MGRPKEKFKIKRSRIHPYRLEYRVYGLPHYKRKIDKFLHRMYGNFIYFLIELSSFFKGNKIRVFLYNEKKDKKNLNLHLIPLFNQLYKRISYILSNKHPIIFYRLRRNHEAFRKFWKTSIVHNIYVLTVFFFLVTAERCQKKKLKNNVYLFNNPHFKKASESVRFCFHFWLKPEMKKSFQRLFHSVYSEIKSPMFKDKKFRQRQEAKAEAKRYLAALAKKGPLRFLRENIEDGEEIYNTIGQKEDNELGNDFGEGFVIMPKWWRKELGLIREKSIRRSVKKAEPKRDQFLEKLRKEQIARYKKGHCDAFREGEGVGPFVVPIAFRKKITSAFKRGVRQADAKAKEEEERSLRTLTKKQLEALQKYKEMKKKEKIYVTDDDVKKFQEKYGNDFLGPEPLTVPKSFRKKITSAFMEGVRQADAKAKEEEEAEKERYFRTLTKKERSAFRRLKEIVKEKEKEKEKEKRKERRSKKK